MAQNKTIADLTKTVATLTRQLQKETTGNNRGPGFPGDRRIQTNSKWVNGKHLQEMGGGTVGHMDTVWTSAMTVKCVGTRKRDIKIMQREPTSWEETRTES